MPLFFGRLYSRLGTRYLPLFLGFEVFSAFVICWGTVGLLALYEPMSAAEFWRILMFSEACVVLALTLVITRVKRMAAPLYHWLRAGKPRDGALEAWSTAVSLPRDFVVRTGWHPFVIVSLPISIFFTLTLDLPLHSAVIIFGAALVAVSYAAVLHFFASEAFLRPILEDISRLLPKDLPGLPAGVPLRWKLLGALPLINVITGVVVSGLSTDGVSSIGDLGLDVAVAVGVAFTISLELTVLVAKSVMRGIDDLLRTTERVKAGELEARAPLVSGDEMGALAGSFNEMMGGLSERDALRQAFGSYVDPEVAKRVVEEGELLEGDDVEVTIMFCDIRDFTPFAERSSARETVAYLNEFFDLVVPKVLEHRGHANKFLGDGLLAVFGAPERLPDHADHALAAACAIARAVEERFGDRVRIGVGLNSGPVVVGSVGGGGRLEFSVIGDAVNVAARVENMTRETGDTVLLTEATRCLVERIGTELEPRGELPLKGKSERIRLYAAVALDERSTEVSETLTAEA